MDDTFLNFWDGICYPTIRRLQCLSSWKIHRNWARLQPELRLGQTSSGNLFWDSNCRQPLYGKHRLYWQCAWPSFFCPILHNYAATTVYSSNRHDMTRTVVFGCLKWEWISFMEGSTQVHESFSCQTALWRFRLIQKRISFAISIWSRFLSLVPGLVIRLSILSKMLGKVLSPPWSMTTCLLWVKDGPFPMLVFWLSVDTHRRMLRSGKSQSSQSK